MSTLLTSTQREALESLVVRPDVVLIREAFSSTGFHLAIVGGSVRDALIGVCRPDMDIDLTTDADPDTIERILDPLGPIWTAGKSFGTIAVAVSTVLGVSKIEVTQWRTDVYDASSRKPEVARAVSLEHDLERRDASVNAMAVDLGTHNGADPCLVDPFGGLADLEAKLLRTPGDPDRCFTDDPLRIVRLVRFAARLGAVPHPDTLAAACRQAGRLRVVSAERVEAELDAIASCSPQVFASAVRLFEQIGVLPAVFGVDVSAEAVAATLDALSGERVEHVHDVVVAVLVGPKARAHRPLPVARLRRMEAVCRPVFVAGFDSGFDPVPVFALLRRDVEPTVSGLRVAVAAGVADAGIFLDAVMRRLAEFPFFVTDRLPVDGNDLLAVGLRGAAVGEALRRVELAFCADPSLTRTDALALVAS